MQIVYTAAGAAHRDVCGMADVESVGRPPSERTAEGPGARLFAGYLDQTDIFFRAAKRVGGSQIEVLGSYYRRWRPGRSEIRKPLTDRGEAISRKA
jgi:hypothetical protein